MFPIPINVDSLELFEKYLRPHTWEGELWIDGGWGPKNLIQELIADDPISGFKLPFYIKPENDINFSLDSKESNCRYLVAFPGEQWRILYNFMNAVKQLGVKEQRYILNSYFSSELPREGSQIYQLQIIVREDSTTITIEKGKWIPSFDDSLLIAGWS